MPERQPIIYRPTKAGTMGSSDRSGSTPSVEGLEAAARSETRYVRVPYVRMPSGDTGHVNLRYVRMA